MPSWIYWSILTIISFGLWGVFSKIAVDSMGWRNATILYTLGFVWVAPVLFLLYRPSIHVVGNDIAIVFALLAGAVSVAAIVGFNIALTTGEAAVVVPLTSLYPLITIVISLLFLHEKLTLTQGIGISLAIVAVILISI